ncbi:threonyl-tRNA synthetase [Mycoplasma wenyonii str. Massachusetts]|uniref:threonine--tRNA ligase n=1 Tax=Mycoplasma wenyonii (strain Massachusetts) TaxID=1197325 RepID=I6Z665_MYCWM|nr:aminoacyl--tRNA ligase-related protein [Mycoplasma wenyonii]AFN65068.1 threonyl-tRNA synthetase [Mycoplasma wenyonii str. Massachusetts]
MQDIEGKKEKEESFDHRTFGTEQDWFFSNTAPGFLSWGPQGYRLKELIRNYINAFQREVCGIQLVKTPVLAKKELFLKTGHLPLYSENIFSEIKKDEEELILRPMTCPHHILLAKELITSKSQLPYFMGENSLLHRDEYSGGLLGLKRVRAMELIDTHIFLLPEQAGELIPKVLSWIWKLLKKFEIELKEIVLATKATQNKYISGEEEWEQVESLLFNSTNSWAKENNLSSLLVKRAGDAAFYGPKIDFNAVDKQNQTYTISTLQLDCFMTKRLEFELDSLNPWIIHLGLIGTLERFIAYLIERYQGKLPFWLCPTQISIIPIDVEKFEVASQALSEKLSKEGFRAQVVLGKERFTKKLLLSSKAKIPFQILIGEKEAQSLESLQVRQLGIKEPKHFKLQEFIDYLKELNSEAQL